MNEKQSTLFHTQAIKKTNKYERSFSSYHAQDCCEYVYVDTDHEAMYTDQIKGEFNKVEYRTAPGDGFYVKLYFNEEYKGQIYYPCYNEQNGYYNDELDLIIDGLKYSLQDLHCVNNENGG